MVSVEVFYVVKHLAINHLAVRSLDEAELVDTRVERKRVDQTDIGTFRSLNRADTAVVRWVNVANLKTSALTIQTTRSKCGETTFMSQFSQWVDLVHELRQLTASKEITNHRAKCLRVDQLLRADRIDALIVESHALFDQALCAGEADATLVGQEFTYSTHTTATQVVNIVECAIPTLQA